MKTKQFIQLLIKAGCFKLREGGNHEIWYSPRTGKKATIPRHGSQELGKGIELRLRKRLLG